jgi:hypothetical protein
MDRESSPSIIRMIMLRRVRLARHVLQMGEKRNAYRMLVGSLEGKRLLGSPRHMWLDSNEMCLREIS